MANITTGKPDVNALKALSAGISAVFIFFLFLKSGHDCPRIRDNL